MPARTVTSPGELYAYEDPGFEYTPSDERIHAAGAVWDPVSGESDDGRRLSRVSGRRLFASAWQDVHGEDSFVRPA